MEKIKLTEATIRIYEELYKQATLRSDYELRIDIKVENQLNKFTYFLLTNYRQEVLTIDFLITYFEWQFHRYVGIKTKYGNNSILIHWLIGKEALKKWQTRNVLDNWKVSYKINKDVGLRLKKAFKNELELESKISLKKTLLDTNPTEEDSKLKFYNKPEGLLWCGTITTLFNPNSELCLGCKNKDKCLNVLLKNFPNIHKVRMTAWKQKS